MLIAKLQRFIAAIESSYDVMIESYPQGDSNPCRLREREVS